MGAVMLRPRTVVDKRRLAKALQGLENLEDHREAWGSLVRPDNFFQSLAIALIESVFIGQQAGAIDSDIRHRLEGRKRSGGNNGLKAGIVDIFWRAHCLLLFGGLSLAYFPYAFLTAPEEILETVEEVGGDLSKVLIECPVFCVSDIAKK